MLKKVILSVLLVVALAGVLPLLGGCQHDTIKTHEESNTSTSETHTVVD